MLSTFAIVAFTHQQLGLKELGRLVIPCQERISRLAAIKAQLQLDEIFCISTCNRVELVMVSSSPVDSAVIPLLVTTLLNDPDADLADALVASARFFSSFNALEHLVRVSCSIESMVVGEKEILAQVRSDYEVCKKAALTGDILRLVMNCVVKAAKQVYTHTQIAQKPISVVSLAYRRLRLHKISLGARVIIIGAGKTNALFSKYLVKHGFNQFTLFNRTPENARILGAELGAEVLGLDALANYKKGFDLLICCTGATEPVISPALYSHLLAGESTKKIIIDLGLPPDVDPGVISIHPVHYIDMAALQEIARRNQLDRLDELSHAEMIISKNIEEFKPQLHARRIELAMQEVPRKIREIRKRATESVFVKDLESLDAGSRRTLENVLNYMEKKYISLPMLMAKEIMGKS